MYPGGGQQPPAASGQQSAFSHPPHLVSSNNHSRLGSNTPPSHLHHPPSPYAQSSFASSFHPHQSQHSFMARHGSGSGAGLWSPMANSSVGPGDEDDDDDEEEDDEDDEEEEEEEEEEKDAAGKKRKRGEAEGSKGAKGAKRGKAGGGEDGADNGEETGSGGKKPKPTRGAKACKNCRRLKMRCVGAQDGPPCDRCKHTNHACIFEESNRGKRSGKNQRTEAMAASLRKMEATMNSLIQSLKDPSSAFTQGAGMLTRSPSPNGGAGGSSTRERLAKHFDDRSRYTDQINDRERLRRGWPSVDEADELGRAYGAIREGKGTTGKVTPARDESVAQGTFVGQSLKNLAAASPGGGHIDPKALGAKDGESGVTSNTSKQMGTRFVEPDRPASSTRHASPRLHSLPDNTLNPLGLLAEASLHNSQRSRRSMNRGKGSLDDAARSSLRGPSGVAGSSGASASSPSGSVSNSAAGGQAGSTDSPVISTRPEVQEDGSSPGKKSDGDRGEAKASTVQLEEYEEFPGAERAKEAKAKGSLSSLSAAVAEGTPGGAEKEERYHLGVASEAYFKPGPMTILPLRRIVIERELAPELLTQGIITSQEVLELFQIFFHHCSQHVVLLDPEWHTPTMICSRSPFLFTVICTIAAKFYTKRPDLHLKCLQMVRKSAYLIMSRGFKSVEIVQGFMLLTLWNTPAERFEEDKTWLFSGVAIRMATDLNLHRKSVASVPGHHQPDDPIVLEREREIINRERTWLVCFSIDRSISGQMGKPWTIREDWIIRNSRHWCMQRLSQPWDLGICGLVELMRLSSRQLDSLYSSTTSVSGLNTDIDYSTILRVFNEQMEEWHSVWQARGFFTSPHDRTGAANGLDGVPISKAEEEVAESLRAANTKVPPTDDEDHHRRTLHFLTKQAPLRYNYAVLILNSFGLQHAVDFPTRSGLDKGLYFTKCLQAAKAIVFAARDGVRPILAYSPDPLFVIISYACVFLLKLTRPTFSAYVDEEDVLSVVAEGATLLESVAMNPTHTPALYASFLRALLQSRIDRTATNRSGATTPHRSRAASPMDAQEGDQVGSENAVGYEDRVDDEVPPHTASMFTSIGGSLGGNNGTSLTAEQAAMLQGYVDGQGGNASGASGLGGNGLPIDHLLNESFWGSLLPPGFGGPLDGLATGSVDMFPSGNGHGPPASHFAGTASMNPSNNQTRANSPSMLNTFGPNVSFDFSAGSLS